jgi:MFS family permease
MEQQLQREERSLGDLFSELANETGTLVRQEVSLAQAEMTQKAVRAGKNVGFLAVGGAVGYAALLAAVTGAIIVLANFIPAWLAAFIVAAIVGAVAYFLVTSALAELKKANMAPTETVETIKEDAKWLKKQMT